MKNGHWIFYMIEHRLIAAGPYLRKGKLKPVDDAPWNHSSWEYFNNALDPKQKQRLPHIEINDVYSTTGYHGWWTLKFAIEALKRLQKADKRGDYDSRNFSTHEKIRETRHEFRIVKYDVAKNMEVILVDKKDIKMLQRSH